MVISTRHKLHAAPSPQPSPSSTPAPTIIPVPKGRILKDSWLSSYMKYAEGHEAPQSFHFYTALTIMAAALRRHVWIDHAYYKIHPNLYTCLVATSAECRKTAGSAIGISFLSKIKDIVIFREKGSTEGLIAYMQKSQRYNINGKIITDSSICIYAPELSTFLSSASYSADLSMVLTSMYDAPDIWPYHTKKDPIFIEGVAPTMLGASTPGMLAKILSAATIEGGFPGRILFVVQTERGKKIPRPTKIAEIQQLEKDLQHDLQHIANLYGEMQYTDAGGKFYDDWYINLEPANNDPRLAGYFQRKHTTVLKIATIISLSKSDNLLIDVGDIKAAIRCVEDLEKNILQAFQYVGTNTYAVGEEVIDVIQKAGGYIIHGDLAIPFRSKMKNPKEFKDVIDSLVESRLIWTTNANRHRYVVLSSIDEAEFKMRLIRGTAERMARGMGGGGSGTSGG